MKKSIKKIWWAIPLALILLQGAAPALNEKLFPEKMIQDFLSTYNSEERSDIEMDLQNIRNLVFKKAKKDNPLYLLTAGGPLSRKSTTLESYIAKDPRFADLAYIDPDARSLFFMINTYHAKSLNYGTVSLFDNFADAKKEAYNKWRWASNYIAHTLLEEAFAQKIGIAHGTTSTSPAIAVLLEKMKRGGYTIEMILCDAELKAKEIALQERNHVQYNYQTTPEDLVNKAVMFYERLPVYFKFADVLYIHYTESLKDDYLSAAVIDVRKKEISISNPDKYQKFVLSYEGKRKLEAPHWDEFISGFKLVAPQA